MDNNSGAGHYGSFASDKVNTMLSSKGETKKVITETFDEPIIPDLAFNFRWTVWEQYESKGMQDYTDTMMKVAWFGDPITFWRVWNRIPHSDPKKFFSFVKDGKSYVNYYEIRGVEQKISSLALFKTGIIPAWEDQMNKHGGEFSTKVNSDEKSTKGVWNALVLDLVTDNFPGNDRVCGIRVLDKGKQIKLEVWVDYGMKKD